VEVKRLFLIIGAILLAGLISFGLSNTAISVADTGVPDNKMTASQTQASNSSASATITITMYAVAGE
jgi:hypothetical protein